MNICPHGHAHPISITEAVAGAASPKSVAAPKMMVIVDSRFCPLCLQERIDGADAILARIALLPPVDRETYQLLRDYIVRYNP